MSPKTKYVIAMSLTFVLVPAASAVVWYLKRHVIEDLEKQLEQ